MPLRRYTRTPVIGLGTQYGTSAAIVAIRENIKNGNIRYIETQLQDKQRLDSLAGQYYNDGRLWWLIAAASGIGYSLQVPAGTLIRIPNLADASTYVG